MLTPDEASEVIARHLPRLPAEDCPLQHAHGRWLRQEVRADRAMPPFDRVTMDGYALRAAAIAEGRRQFRVIGSQAAGMRALTIDADDECVEISTGAVLPTGADAVVPYEQVERIGTQVRLTVDVHALRPGANVHRRGSDLAPGDVVLATGQPLNGGAIAAAAACGAAHVRVASLPRVAVVATGDELVEVEVRDVAAHQIRRSNDYALRAAVLLSGLANRVDRLHLRDLRSEVEQGLRHILSEYDVVLLTGGVSKGQRDFVPAVLAELAVEQKVRGIAQRPGKPMWFGLSARRTPVFALPGNPVSAYTCFFRYVRPALELMAGAPPAPAEWVSLDESVRFAAPLTYFLPVQVKDDPTARRRATPAPFNTSGDLGGLVGTDGFVELPPGSGGEFRAGTIARFWSWR